MANNIIQPLSCGAYSPFQIGAPLPIIAQRSPLSSDLGYAPGTEWLDQTATQGWLLISNANGIANWVLLATPAAGGAFTTLSSSGNTTLGTGSGTVNTLGSTGGASGTTISVGTGNFILQGAAGSTIAIGTGLTTGTILIGGSAETGNITLGSSSGTNSISIGVGGGAGTIAIGGTGANVVNIANSQTAGSFSVGAAMTTATVSIGGTGLQTGNFNLAPGTGAQSIFLGASGTGAKTIAIGSTSANSSLTLQAGTGATGIKLNAAGNVQMVPALVSAAAYAATLNARVGQATLTGQVLAAAGVQDLVITNSVITGTTQSIFVSVDNLGTNDAQIQIQRILQAASTLTVKVKNQGAAALNGDIHVNWWILN